LKVILFLKTKDLTPGALKELNELVLKVFSSDPRISFEKVFIEDNPKITSLYNITTTPFTIVGDKRFPGIPNAEQILRITRQFVEIDSPVQLVAGAMNLVNGSAFSKIISAISGLNKSGRRALYITKIYPEALAKHYGLDTTGMVWLVPRAMDGSSVSMNDLVKVGQIIDDFIDTNEGAVVIIEGLEVLLKQNPLDSVLDLLKALKIKVAQRMATAFILFLPSAMDETACFEIKALFSE